MQAWYRQQLELEPVRFMETAGLAALVAAVADVAGFVGADWRDVVPVPNATTGVNAVLQSLQLRKGDLVLMTNATYAAVSVRLWQAADSGVPVGGTGPAHTTTAGSFGSTAERGCCALLC